MNWFQKQQNLGKLQSKKYDLEKKIYREWITRDFVHLGKSRKR